MATPGARKRYEINPKRRAELTANFPIGMELVAPHGVHIKVQSYFGDRCIVGSNDIIYNVEANFNYKFAYNQLTDI